MSTTALSDIRLFLLDMDGTVFLGDTLLDGAEELVHTLREQHKDCVFFPNNSSKSAREYIKKLSDAGICCSGDSVFTTGMAAGMLFSREYSGKSVFVCGTRSLAKELEDYGIELKQDGADIVLVGYDTELTYEKIATACRLIDGGALYFATHPDLICPVEGGSFLPDCGSIVNLIGEAVGKAPVFIGKPQRTVPDIIARAKQVEHKHIAIVGDRLYTDIAAGINAGITSVLVLTGETNEAVLAASDIKPDYVFNSVKELNNILIGKDAE